MLRCVLNRFSRAWLCATLWTVACQAPPSMWILRQGYWSGLPFPSPGDLPDPGIESATLMFPVLAGKFFTTSATWEARSIVQIDIMQFVYSVICLGTFVYLIFFF